MKSIKVVSILTMLVVLFLSMTTMSYAAKVGVDTGTAGVKDVISTDYYKPGDLKSEDYEEAFRLGGVIVNTLRVVGIVIAIAGLMIIGIKYMISSVEQKAEYKKTMIPYLVGCILIFAITTIVSIIYELSSQL